MERHINIRCATIIYTCLFVILSVYLLPFMYIGIGPPHEEGTLGAVNLTVLKLWGDQTGYPGPTRLALFLAQQRTARALLTIGLIVVAVLTELLAKTMIWRDVVYLSVMWIGLVFFFLSVLGLVFLFAVV